MCRAAASGVPPLPLQLEVRLLLRWPPPCRHATATAPRGPLSVPARGTSGALRRTMPKETLQERAVARAACYCSAGPNLGLALKAKLATSLTESKRASRRRVGLDMDPLQRFCAYPHEMRLTDAQQRKLQQQCSTVGVKVG